MNKFIATAAAACLAVSGAAHAATITVSAFDITDFDSATGYSGFVVQNFEDIGADLGAGELPGTLSTNVGDFTTIGGTGTGGVCDESLGVASGGECTNLYLKNTETFGQGNMVPDTNGEWSLNANDTLGITWDVLKGEDGSLFNRVVFAVMDFADTGAKVTVSAGGETVEFDDLTNANQQLIVIDFATMISSATVTMVNSKLNDSFSIDGASVGVVPLPAGGLLLLTGFGVLALRRRRKAA